MNQYFLDLRSGETPGENETLRLFVIIDDTFYWAIEWHGKKDQDSLVIADLNAGFLSAEVNEACAELQEVTPEILRERYGVFTDYIQRSVSGFRSYILWIHPDAEVTGIQWAQHR